ncbi:MAG: hypothetical protein V3V84_07845 [Candidatus Bathyarchaeia archaeon]
MNNIEQIKEWVNDSKVCVDDMIVDVVDTDDLLEFLDSLLDESPRPAPCQKFCEATAFKSTISRHEKSINELESPDKVLMPVEPGEKILKAMHEWAIYKTSADEFKLKDMYVIYKAAIRSIKG